MEKDGQLQAIAALLARAAYPKQAQYALAALQDVRALIGHVPEKALPLIAGTLGMEPAALAALMRDSAQFSAPFETAHRLAICQGAVCIGRGSGDLLAGARKRFAATSGLTVVAGHCLGQCLQAPAASLDGEVLAPVDMDALVQAVAARAG
jgi:formate dehydrogenase subunit gamma